MSIKSTGHNLNNNILIIGSFGKSDMALTQRKVIATTGILINKHIFMNLDSNHKSHIIQLFDNYIFEDINGQSLDSKGKLIYESISSIPNLLRFTQNIEFNQAHGLHIFENLIIDIINELPIDPHRNNQTILTLQETLAHVKKLRSELDIRDLIKSS